MEKSPRVEKLPEHVIAVVDEAYIDFAADAPDTTMVPHLANHPNMIVIQTFSKLYGLAGVRLGYAMACPEIIRYLSKTQAAPRCPAPLYPAGRGHPQSPRRS